MWSSPAPAQTWSSPASELIVSVPAVPTTTSSPGPVLVTRPGMGMTNVRTSPSHIGTTGPALATPPVDQGAESNAEAASPARRGAGDMNTPPGLRLLRATGGQAPA